MALTQADLPALLDLLNQIDIRVQNRRKTAAAWTASNEVLLDGEDGIETDTGKRKTGNGVDGWNSLAYAPALPVAPCLRFTTDTGSTADSDPGAGVMKWNNATQSSATKLFFDDADAGTGTDLSAYFTELAASSTTGILHMVAEDGSFKLYKWTGIADGTGYFKFTVSHLVSSGGNFADNIPVRVAFYPMLAAGGGGGGSVAWTLLNSWDFSVSGAVASIEANLTGYNEVLVIVTDVPLASSGWRALQLSWNGGTTWLTSYDYLNATGTRNTAGNTFQVIHGTAASAARCGTAQFSLMASQEAPVVGTNNMGNIQFLIPAQGTKPNRIKVGGWVTGGPTNMTGGKVAIFVR